MKQNSVSRKMHKHLQKSKFEFNFPNGSNVMMKSDEKPRKMKTKH